jgi:hypothetical protein
VRREFAPLRADCVDFRRRELVSTLAAVRRNEAFECRFCVRVVPLRLLVLRSRSRDSSGCFEGFAAVLMRSWCASASALVGNAAR